MVQKKEVIFYVFDEGVKWVKQLVETKPEHFSHVDLSKILVVMRQGQKHRANAYIERVPPLYSLITEIQYFIVCVYENFNVLNKAQKIICLYHELLHIPIVFGDRLIKHDIEDFSSVLDTFGVHWQADDKVPNILDKTETKKK